MQTQTQTETPDTQTTERPATAREFQVSREVAREINQIRSERSQSDRVVWTDVFRALERCGVFPAEGL